MKKFLGLAVGTVILTLSPALAAVGGTTTTPVPINATTLNSCIIDPANANPTIDLAPDYQAANTYSGSNGGVTIIVFCNKGTPISGRRITGNSVTTTAGESNSVEATLTKDGGTDTVNVRVWFTVGTSSTPSSGTYAGATRYTQRVEAGWKGGQYGASSGFYSGSVQFAVTF